ncbi:MAG: type II secretion system F family protein [Lachnospiraceae bacterium]|nr:type II secretion system F family protein [Lachnospiraceae bacterium]
MLEIGLIISISLFVFSFVTLLLYLLFRERVEIKEQLHALSMMTEQEPEKNVSHDSIKRRGKREKKTRSAALRKLMITLENELYDIGVDIQVENFLIIWIFSAIILPLLMLLLNFNSMIAIGTAIVISVAPIIFIRLRRSKRRKELESQLIDAITIMCNAMKAGHSFQTAMNAIATEMKGPIADEFGRVFRETIHGMSIEESLKRMVERVGSPELEMLSTAVAIQRETGGNMSEILTNIAGTIQSRVIMRKEVKTRTSSGRVSGYIVGSLPVFLIIVLSVMNPDYCKPLFNTDTGRMLLAAGAVMELIGFIVIQKIITVKY